MESTLFCYLEYKELIYVHEKIILYESLKKWQIEMLNKILNYDLFGDLTTEEITAYREKKFKDRSAKIAAAMPNKKPVLQFDKNKNFIMRFESTGEASRQTGIATPKTIAKCCRGERKEVGGYIWEYDS